MPEHIDFNYKVENTACKLPWIEISDNMSDFIQYCSWIEYVSGN
jgi:hypothetical protein